MLDVIELPNNVPQASHTSWCVGDDGKWIFTLHDKHDKVIAMATYSFADWIETFCNLARARIDYLGRNIQ
jgi:hypothetical protein